MKKAVKKTAKKMSKKIGKKKAGMTSIAAVKAYADKKYGK